MPLVSVLIWTPHKEATQDSSLHGCPYYGRAHLWWKQGGSIPCSSNLISTSLSNSRFPGNPSSVLCLGEHPVLDEDGLKVQGWAECLHHLNPSPVKTWESHAKSWVFHGDGSPLPNLQETLPQTISLRTEGVLEKTLSLPQDCSAQGCVSLCIWYTFGYPRSAKVPITHPASLTPGEQSSHRTFWTWLYLQHSSQMSEEVLLFCLVCISYGNGGRNTFQELHKSEVNMQIMKFSSK